MRWTRSFPHNDSSWTDVTVDEAGLVEAFDRAMKRESPCHVIAVEEASDDAELDEVEGR